MKVPIEFVDFSNKNILDDESIIELPRDFLSVSVGKESSCAALSESFMTRINEIIDKSKFIENYIQIQISELSNLDSDSIELLSNSEIDAIINSMDEIYNYLYNIRSSISQIINSDINLSNDYYKLYYLKNFLENRLSEAKQLMNIQYDNLYHENKALAKGQAYINSYSELSTYNFQDFSKNFSILKENIEKSGSLYSTAENNIKIITDFAMDTDFYLKYYQCFLDTLQIVMERFKKMYNDLYSSTYKDWIRLIGASYIREGENIYLNRDCGHVIVSAMAPPLPDCPPVQYMHVPPPQVVNIPGPVPDCPTCPPPTTTTTTTTTTRAPNANEGSGYCEWPTSFNGVCTYAMYDNSGSMNSGNPWGGGASQLSIAASIVNRLNTYLTFGRNYYVGTSAGSSALQLAGTIDAGIKYIKNHPEFGCSKVLIIRIDDSEDSGTVPKSTLDLLERLSIPVYVLHIRLLENSTSSQYSNVFKQTSSFLDAAVAANKIDCWNTLAFYATDTANNNIDAIFNRIKTLIPA